MVRFLNPLDINLEQKAQFDKNCQLNPSRSSISSSPVSAGCKELTKKLLRYTLKTIANEKKLENKEQGSVKYKSANETNDKNEKALKYAFEQFLISKL